MKKEQLMNMQQELLSSVVGGQWQALPETIGRIHDQLTELATENPLELVGMGLTFGAMAAQGRMNLSPRQLLVRGGFSVLLSQATRALSSRMPQKEERTPSRPQKNSSTNRASKQVGPDDSLAV